MVKYSSLSCTPRFGRIGEHKRKFKERFGFKLQLISFSMLFCLINLFPRLLQFFLLGHALSCRPETFLKKLPLELLSDFQDCRTSLHHNLPMCRLFLHQIPHKNEYIQKNDIKSKLSEKRTRMILSLKKALTALFVVIDMVSSFAPVATVLLCNNTSCL